ncbi:DUF445 domain-containing protein [Extensimonas perlucida]|uniref:DUF445 domain-containing protein n=1 Tax=Extensimonas perlucida TaxID=2590786 RepID=UPI001FE36171|nr:DUF445 family protein [Extensimonas perlucida]
MTDQARALQKAKRQAGALLVLMAALFAASYALPRGLGADCLRAMAEAAIVGGLADWFAVSALFRRIPLPLLQRHTDIVVRNKERIGGNLARFVRDKFLDPPSLVALIRRNPPTALLAQWLNTPANAELLGRQLARLALAALEMVEDAQVQRLLRAAARTLIGQLDLTRSMAAVLQALTHEGRHQAVLDDLLERLAQLLRAEDTRAFIAATIVQWLKREHPLKEKVLPSEWLSDKGANAIAHAVESLLAEIARNPEHQLRDALDDALQRLIVRLQSDPAWERKGEEIRRYLQTDPTVGAYAESLWGGLRQRLQRDLADEHSALVRRIAGMGQWLGRALAGDALLRERLDAQLELWAVQWAPEVSQFFAQHIEGTVQRWDAREMAQLLELHLGPDLQHIRINGTLVGGLIGLLLFALSHAGALYAAMRDVLGR